MHKLDQIEKGEEEVMDSKAVAERTDHRDSSVNRLRTEEGNMFQYNLYTKAALAVATVNQIGH